MNISCSSIKIKLLLAIVTIFSFQLQAQHNEKVWQWMQQLGGSGWDLTNGMVADSEDNIYVAGGFHATLKAGGKELESEGKQDIFVASYNKEGSLRWIWNAGGTRLDKITAIAINKKNEIFITGIISGEVKLKNKRVKGDGKKLFVAHISSRGRCRWINSYPISGSASLYLLTADSEGEIYAAGVYSDSLKFEDTKLVSKGKKDIVVCSFTSDGELLHAKSFGNQWSESVSALSAHKTGGVYISGNYRDSFILDSLELKSKSTKQTRNGFLACTNSDLRAKWLMPVSSSQRIKVNALKNHESGELLMAGDYKGTMYYDTLQLTSNGLSDIFIAKLDTTGKPLWMKSYGSKYLDHASSLNINRLGGAMLAGSFNDTLFMDSTELACVSYRSDAFVAQFTPEGVVSWAEVIGGSGTIHCQKSTLDSQGNIYISGSFTGQIKNSEDEWISAGDKDVFVARYYNCPEYDQVIVAPDGICRGSEDILTIGSGYSNIVWNDTIFDVNKIEIGKPGLYRVRMIDKKGCVIKDSVEVKDYPLPEFSIGNDTTVFVGETKTLQGPEDMEYYQWHTNNNISEIVAEAPAGEAGAYDGWLLVSDSLACEFTDSIQINFINEPNPVDMNGHNNLVRTYPNPVKEILHWYLETDREAKVYVELSDVGGNIIYTSEIKRYIPGEVRQINMKNYIPGVYYLGVGSKTKKEVIKIVRQ